MVTFGLAILAGMGLEYYRKNIDFSTLRQGASLEEYIRLRKFLKGILILGFISSFLYLIVNLNFVSINAFLYNKVLDIAPSFMDKKDKLWQLIYAGVYNIKRGFGFFMILSILIFLPLHRKIRLHLILPILISISFLDIFTANEILYQNMDIDEYLKPGKTVKFLKKDEGLFRMLNSPTTLRQNLFVPERDYFEGMKSLKERMSSNRGVSFQIYDAYGYGSLYNKRHDEVICLIMLSDLPTQTNLLDLVNVKYVISPKDFEAEGYSLVKKTDKVNIYENRKVLPRAFLVDNPVLIRNEEEILERLKSKDFNPSKEVILEEDFPSTSDERRTRGGETANILEHKPNEVIIEATVNDARFLVLSDTFYPGWKVFVDGKQEKIYRANYILRAVYLRPGKHTVKFTYDPFSFKLGLLITLVTILIVGYLLWKRRL